MDGDDDDDDVDDDDVETHKIWGAINLTRQDFGGLNSKKKDRAGNYSSTVKLWLEKSIADEYRVPLPLLLPP